MTKQERMKSLGLAVLEWHGGGGCPTYAVGSSLAAGYDVDAGVVDLAVAELQQVVDKQVPHPECVAGEDVGEVQAIQERLRAYRDGRPVEPIRKPIRTWADGDYRLELFDTLVERSINRPKLAYRFFHQGRLIFEGDDYTGPSGAEVGSDKMIGDLLFWLSLQPGEASDEVFESYTPEQLEWAKRHGDALKCVADVLENSEG